MVFKMILLICQEGAGFLWVCLCPAYLPGSFSCPVCVL